MNKAWLTSITVAGIAGSAGAAFAGVSAIHSASAETATPSSEATAAAATVRTITYQIGNAGVVTLTTDGTSITVTNSAAADGWTLVGASAAGAHVEVQFTDTQQLVTFGADQVGDDVVVSLTNVEAPGATTTSVPAPMKVTIVSQTPRDDHHGAPKPTPTPAPAPTPPPTVTTEHVTPPTAATSNPSPAGHTDDSHESDDHEEGNDD